MDHILTPAPARTATGRRGAASAKLVLTHAGLLEAKYGRHVDQVWKALDDLVDADRRRGLATRLVRLDAAADMAALHAAPLEKGRDPLAVKQAVDRVVHAARPDYVLLLGAPDVLPQQPLAPPFEDRDAVIPSDLPYACEAGPSLDVHEFTAPTRVVGRLPGVVGSDDPALLVSAIETAAGWEPRDPAEYSPPLAIATEIWKGSTEKSLRKVFGDAAELKLVPPENDRWPKELLARRAHYINCHGIPGKAIFEGQDGDKYPVALAASYVAHRLAPGTVAAVECCYGAQLYDPDGSEPLLSMANTYLRYGAYAYFGSSTSTYAPFEFNDSADLMCQNFLRQLLAGASAGRAALEARQEYMHSHPTLDPSDLKTLAQFDLMGDPSVHPVLREADGWSCATDAAGVHDLLAVRRSERRLSLAARGQALHEAATVPHRARKHAVPPEVGRLVSAAVREHGGQASPTASYELRPRALGQRLRNAFGRGKPAVHLTRIECGRDSRGNPHDMLVVAHEEDGQVTAVRRLFSR